MASLLGKIMTNQWMLSYPGAGQEQLPSHTPHPLPKEILFSYGCELENSILEPNTKNGAVIKTPFGRSLVWELYQQLLIDDIRHPQFTMSGKLPEFWTETEIFVSQWTKQLVTLPFIGISSRLMSNLLTYVFFTWDVNDRFSWMYPNERWEKSVLHQPVRRNDQPNGCFQHEPSRGSQHIGNERDGEMSQLFTSSNLKMFLSCLIFRCVFLSDLQNLKKTKQNMYQPLVDSGRQQTQCGGKKSCNSW